MANLLTAPEDFSNAAWTKTNATINTDVTTAPNSTATADKVIGTAIDDEHGFRQTQTTTASTLYTVSIFAKLSDAALPIMRFIFYSTGGTTAFYGVYLNLNTGVADGISGPSGPISNYSYSITDYGSGWWRVAVTAQTTNTTAGLRLDHSAVWGADNYLGDGIIGGYLWGAVLEEGALTNYGFEGLPLLGQAWS